MRTAFHTVAAIAVSLASCTDGEAWKRIAKASDSLAGTLNVYRHELRWADSARHAKLSREFELYTAFISARIDTVDPAEERLLRSYYSAGRDLRTFEANRKKLVPAIDKSIEQIGRLGDDARNHAGDRALLGRRLDGERQRASELIAAARSQRSMLDSALLRLAADRPGVEALVRRHNHGELPFAETGS